MHFQHRAGNTHTLVVNRCLSADCSSKEHGFSTNEEYIGEDIDVDVDVESMSSSHDGESEDECEGGSVEEDDDTKG